eukprot:s6077_g1.t1
MTVSFPIPVGRDAPAAPPVGDVLAPHRGEIECIISAYRGLEFKSEIPFYYCVISAYRGGSESESDICYAILAYRSSHESWDGSDG